MSAVLASATRQLEMLQSGSISIRELAEEHIRQIERLNPALNALVDFDAERVRAQASTLEGSPQAGGALRGLPVTVKSSISTAGYLCEIGSLIHRGHVPKEDAPVVARLREAGALILGTTNCPEFLMAYETDNLLHGRTNNPWNIEYSPGGSSGGESAAIAACMSSAGLGSDSGGSVRQPAHFTGICSLKPTPGRVPGRGHLPPCVGPFSVLGAIGPMARTIEDVTLLFDVLSGQDALDPVSAPVPTRKPNLHDLRRRTVGYFEDDGLVGVTTETRIAVRDAVRALQDAGFRLEPFRPQTLELLRKLWSKFFVQCGAMFYQPAIHGRQSMLSPIFREFLGFAEAARPLSATELLDAWAELDLLRGRTMQEMETFPILLCPVASVPAFRHGERRWAVPGIDGAGCMSVEYLDAMRHTQWFNALAAPAAVVPVGASPEGMPIGVQVIARPWQDEDALAVADVLDRAFGYRTPPIAFAP